MSAKLQKKARMMMDVCIEYGKSHDRTIRKTFENSSFSPSNLKNLWFAYTLGILIFFTFYS